MATASAPASVADAPTPVKASTRRLASIDIVRGAVMILMTLDHARDYAVNANVGDPMLTDTVAPAMFLTRLLSHFCAPVFIVLAGVSARLLAHKGMTSSAIAKHLLTRGLILVALELTVVDWAWNFYPLFPMKYLQVIWAIGLSMIVLAALVRLPIAAIVAIGCVLVFGHNLLDATHVSPDTWTHAVWSILHERNVLDTGLGLRLRTTYPILPAIGLICLGYGLGGVFAPSVTPERRQRRLLWLAASATLLFIILRATNLYGDAGHFVLHTDATRSIMSFFNPTKYPLSLQFVLMTLGPACAALALLEDRGNWLTHKLAQLGHAPMFYYLAHLYVIHAAALLVALLMGYAPASFDFQARLGGFPQGFALPLWGVYALSAVTIAVLYPAVLRYAAARRTRGGWLRYL